MGDFLSILQKLMKNRLSAIGSIIILLILAIAFFAPYVSPYDPLEMNAKERLQVPNLRHLLGTDNFGRDTLSRIIYASRLSLVISSASVSAAMVMGIFLGVMAAYYSKKLDNIIMRLLDILYAFPPIFLAIGVMAVLGPGVFNVIIALGLAYTPIFARIVRGSFLSIKEQGFVEAARAVGVREHTIILRYCIPNIMAPIIVAVTINLSVAILAEAALSFLGLGSQPPTASLGLMLSESRYFMEIAPWTAIFPGLTIMLCVLGLNLLGDGLRDALDPRISDD